MLSLEEVEVAIQGTKILRGVTLRVPEGGRIGLVGRNGAGKTTTFRAIMGLLPLERGGILFDGASLARWPAHRRVALGIGYAPEDRRLFPNLTVEENLRLPAEALGLAPAERQRRLERVWDLLPELRELRDRRAGALSGGQGKIAALGRALVTGTRLLLLDEPFQGLAPALARRYGEILARLVARERGLALLVSESNPELVAPFVDAVVTIERGEIAAVTRKPGL
ncbi:MAG: ATP-binding cassette domain-containing protein [Geminicoccaceae bacterium]|nr:ATP-binding cassette domain-containing protein [Geminicoccaceae bacterium]MDW8342345.1 ATP-binding cassette domain-containing protein [Geminicoccaceae bacterium]